MYHDPTFYLFPALNPSIDKFYVALKADQRIWVLFNRQRFGRVMVCGGRIAI